MPSNDPDTFQTQNDFILSIKDELENLKQEIGFLDIESLCGLTPIQQFTFIKILLNAKANDMLDVFSDSILQGKLIDKSGMSTFSKKKK